MNKHLIWNEMWWLILILRKNISIHVCSIMFDPCCTMFCQEHTHANDFTGGESELVKWNLYHILLGIRLRSKWMESNINGVIRKEWGFMNLNGIARFNPIRIFQFLNFTFVIFSTIKKYDKHNNWSNWSVFFYPCFFWGTWFMETSWTLRLCMSSCRWRSQRYHGGDVVSMPQFWGAVSFILNGYAICLEQWDLGKDLQLWQLCDDSDLESTKG